MRRIAAAVLFLVASAHAEDAKPEAELIQRAIERIAELEQENAALKTKMMRMVDQYAELLIDSAQKHVNANAKLKVALDQAAEHTETKLQKADVLLESDWTRVRRTYPEMDNAEAVAAITKFMGVWGRLWMTKAQAIDSTVPVSEILCRAALYEPMRDAARVFQLRAAKTEAETPGWGEISEKTGRPKKVFVRAHWRSSEYNGYAD